MDNDKQERIGLRAYRIWEESGRPAGKDSEHWHQAEREIEEEDGKAGAQGPGATAPSAAKPSRPRSKPVPAANTGKPATAGSLRKPASPTGNKRKPVKP